MNARAGEHATQAAISTKSESTPSSADICCSLFRSQGTVNFGPWTPVASMMREPSPESRLERIEARLERLEHLEEDARSRAQRRRRRELWTRVTLALVVGAAYLLYVNYVSGIA